MIGSLTFTLTDYPGSIDTMIGETAYSLPQQSASNTLLGPIIATMLGYAPSVTLDSQQTPVSGAKEAPDFSEINTSVSSPSVSLSSFTGAQHRQSSDRSLMICTFMVCLFFGGIIEGLYSII